MEFDLEALPPRPRYKLLSSVVVPRPIAWTTTRDAEGRINAAPYSYFNLMGTDPPVVALGPQYRQDFVGDGRDILRNIRTRGGFVINIVNEALAQQMDQTAQAYPAQVDELEAAGLKTVPAERLDAPRIAGAPACLECREHQTTFVGNTCIVLGEVLHLYIRDDLVESERFHVKLEALRAVGRMGGGRYARTRDLFDFKD